MQNNFQLWEAKNQNGCILIRTQYTKIYVAEITAGANKHKDAALIAAAPELLAALQTAYNFLKNGNQHETIVGEQMLNAINKVDQY
jgi:plasmid maintenance system antidote protein VapI